MSATQSRRRHWLCRLIGCKYVKRTWGPEYVTTRVSDQCWRCPR